MKKTQNTKNVKNVKNAKNTQKSSTENCGGKCGSGKDCK